MKTAPPGWQDRDLVSAVDEARWQVVHPMAHVMLLVLASFIVLALLWAAHAPLDEVVVGMGKVIPSRHVQMVQNLEGGILSELLVAEGQMVARDQVLLRIDDTRFSAQLMESRARLRMLRARQARLQAAVSGKPFAPPRELEEQEPAMLAREAALLLAERQELAAQLAGLERQQEMKRQELLESEAQERHLERRAELTRKEVAISEPLVARKVVSDVEMLRLRRLAAELEGSLEVVRLAQPRLRAAVGEIEQRSRELEMGFLRRTQGELNQVSSEINALQESMASLQDQVARAEVKAPVHGTVLRVRLNTLGQVVRSGENLVEIMPRDDTLLVEAKLSPADIAFLKPGQMAMVKFTAYDFAIYGGLRGVLEHISADALTDERGEVHYLIRVRTERNHLGDVEKPLEILPGMVATVDIMTGKKTVLDYLLKPIARAHALALRER